MFTILREAYKIALPLFFILNIIGNAPLFIALLAKYKAKDQRRIMIREMSVALFILLLFFYFGEGILNTLGISQAVIGIAGGVLLFILSLGMVFPKPHDIEASRIEPFIVPLATPGIAGPGAIATVMVYAGFNHPGGSLVVPAAILLAWIPSLLILLAASNLRLLIGEKGMLACERLGGMIMTLISIQMLTQGIVELVKTSFKL